MADHGLGCVFDEPDPRDFALAALVPALAEVLLPETLVVPRHDIRQQGARGTCVAVAGSQGDQRVHASGDLSEEWLWHRCKSQDGLSEEQGTYPRVMLDILLKQGCPEERYLPYNATADALDGADANAALYRIGSYAAVALDYEAIQRARFLNGPVFLALKIHDSFLQTGKDGIVAMPSGALRGGHLVCYDGGYDVRGLEVPNTWGYGWGDHGYCWLRAEVLEPILMGAWSIVDETLIDLWPDWGDAERVAGKTVKDSGLMQGYHDGLFRPYALVSIRQVALVASRMSVPVDLLRFAEDYTPATRAFVRDLVPGLTWLEERWDERLTRWQFALLIARKLQGR